MTKPARFPRVERYREELANLTFAPVAVEMASFYKVLVQDAMSAAAKQHDDTLQHVGELRFMMMVLIDARVPIDIFSDILGKLLEEQSMDVIPMDGR
ncbi:hypothetical protein ACWM9A_15005 [Acetobacter pasteurianus]